MKKPTAFILLRDGFKMAKQLHTIIKDSLQSRSALPVLLWIDKLPSWTSGTMFMVNDCNLQRYFGNYLLEYLYGQLHYKEGCTYESIVGAYRLEVRGNHLHLQPPSTLLHVPGFNDIDIGLEIQREVQTPRDQLLDLTFDHKTKMDDHEKTPVYHYILPLSGNHPAWFPSEGPPVKEFYLRQDQVDYFMQTQNVPEKEITIGCNKRGVVLFSSGRTFAGITLMNPGYVKMKRPRRRR